MMLKRLPRYKREDKQGKLDKQNKR